MLPVKLILKLFLIINKPRIGDHAEGRDIQNWLGGNQKNHKKSPKMAGPRLRNQRISSNMNSEKSGLALLLPFGIIG